MEFVLQRGAKGAIFSGAMRHLILAISLTACGATTGNPGAEQRSAEAGAQTIVGGAESDGGTPQAGGPTARGGEGGSPDVPVVTSGGEGGAAFVVAPGGAAGASGAADLGEAGSEAGGGAGGAANGAGGEPTMSEGGAPVVVPVDPWKQCDGGKVCSDTQVCVVVNPGKRDCIDIDNELGQCSLKISDPEFANCCASAPPECNVPYEKCGLFINPATGKSCGQCAAIGGHQRYTCGPPL